MPLESRQLWMVRFGDALADTSEHADGERRGVVADAEGGLTV